MEREDAAGLIERIVDAGAASALACAVGFSGYALAANAAVALATSTAAGFTAWLVLRRIKIGNDIMTLPEFSSAPLELSDTPEELLLTADQVVAPADELLLDDILEELGPDARVVRLFARPAVPTAGELSATIDRHLQAGSDRFQGPDASDALMNALADLRRSLR